VVGQLKAKIVVLTVLALALAAGGIAVAAVNNNEPPSFSQYEEGRHAQLATSADVTQASTFSVLRRDRTADDELPSRLASDLTRQGHFTGVFGANVDLARHVKLAAGNIWVIPGNGAICIYATSNLQPSTAEPGAPSGGSCEVDSDATQGHLSIESETDELPGKDFVAGLVPDGVSNVVLRLASGKTQTFAVTENVYIALVSGHVNAVQFEGANGPITLTRNAK
jgi:hypothetical protein